MSETDEALEADEAAERRLAKEKFLGLVTSLAVCQNRIQSARVIYHVGKTDLVVLEAADQIVEGVIEEISRRIKEFGNGIILAVDFAERIEIEHWLVNWVDALDRANVLGAEIEKSQNKAMES